MVIFENEDFGRLSFLIAIISYLFLQFSSAANTYLSDSIAE
jgi:hypothetical protein